MGIASAKCDKETEAEVPSPLLSKGFPLSTVNAQPQAKGSEGAGRGSALSAWGDQGRSEERGSIV